MLASIVIGFISGFTETKAMRRLVEGVAWPHSGSKSLAVQDPELERTPVFLRVGHIRAHTHVINSRGGCYQQSSLATRLLIRFFS